MRLRLLLIIPAVVLGLTLSASTIHAQETSAIKKMRDDFCEARSGDVINLQTWYSGKCVKGDVKATDPEAIGFSDIVLLDIYTRLAGEEDSGLLKTVEDLILDKDGTNPQPVAYGNGLIGGFNTLLYHVFTTPPASTTEYLAYVSSNLSKRKLVQPAYAQSAGFGFQALSPVLPVWKAFRNVAYGLFVLAFVLYGFMIMFRRKISPQAVINIQMAIPKLVMVLLLITFSYAIAGFLIDLMYVILNLFFAVLIANDMVEDDLLQVWGIGNVTTLKILVRMLTHITFGGLIEKMLAAIIGLPTELAGVGTAALALFTTGGSALIIFIIFLVAILYVLVKVLWLLIEAYVKILLGIIFSPLILLQDLIPKRTSTFNDWVLGLTSNISMFLTGIVMFTFAFIFIGDLKPFGLGDIVDGFGATALAGRLTGLNDFKLPTGTGQLWGAPLLIGFGNAENVLALIGFGFFLMTPKIMSVVRDSIKKSTLGLGGELAAPLEYGYFVNYTQSLPGSLLRRSVNAIAGTRRGPGYDLLRGMTKSQKDISQTMSKIKPAKDPFTGKPIGRS